MEEGWRQAQVGRYFVYLMLNVAIALFNWQFGLLIGPLLSSVKATQQPSTPAS